MRSTGVSLEIEALREFLGRVGHGTRAYATASTYRNSCPPLETYSKISLLVELHTFEKLGNLFRVSR